VDKQRSKFLLIVIYLCFLAVLTRLFYWQVIKGSQLHEQAIAQIYKLEKILPRQGQVLSSDGYPLSLDYSYYRLALYKPNFQTDLDTILQEITNIKPEFATQNAKLLEKFREPNQKWLEFLGEFTTSEKNQLATISGTNFQARQKRYYPEDTLAIDLILGLERFYKRQLSGQVGFKRNVIDATGSQLLTKKNWQKSEIDGQDVPTSLHRQVQYLVENTLKQGLVTYQADSASAIILEPKSGQILAMASVEASPSAFSKVKNITHLFEPGSIFKPLVMTAALDSGAINSNWICTRCNQARVIGEDSINNWDKQFHPDSSLKDVITNSDNIGMSYIISHLGLDKFLDYYQKLKLNQKTGVELPGESVSPLKTYWSEIDLATASFGQGIALNQLQMLQAFNSIANDGLLVNAHLNTSHQSQSSRVFSEKSTNTIKEILAYAVDHSPVAKLKSKDMDSVCAKSGTAQVAVAGKYGDNTIGSYIGFYPCINPKYTMIVTISNAQTSQWGSSTAAPIWFELASHLNRLL